MPFTILQPDWVQLSPYGDFPHSHGLQRVSREAAERLVARFDSFSARLGRAFGGLPFYIGHPDAPAQAAQFPDRKAYGWIMSLQARADGLYALAKWSQEGQRLLKNAHYKYVSPYWEAEEIAPGIFAPVRLISAGLTNQPNLPVHPLSNSASTLPVAGPVPRPGVLTPDTTHITQLLDNSILTGRIKPFERALWNQKLVENFEANHTALANLRPAEPPQTLALRKRKAEIAAFTERQQQIQALVREQMQRGLDYDSAWSLVKQEHPALFPQLRN
ncbi:MAG TPA: phage protease [Methylomirabilota bacterium]|nr:phage protease [Methylomirabilota bacterium]